jgi:MFS family permease
MYPVLFAMIACQASVALAAFTLPVVAPAAAAALGVPASLVGYYTTLMIGGAVVATVITGGFVKRFGAMRVSQMTLVFAALGLLALPLTSAGLAIPLLLIASGMLLGFAYGPANPASSHLLARVTPDRLRGRIFSIKQTSIPIGAAACGFILPVLVAWFDWKIAATAVAVFCLLLALALQPLRAAMDADRSPSARIVPGNVAGALRLVLRHPSLRRLAFASGAFAAMQFCFMSLFVTFTVERTGLSLVAVGSAFSSGLVVSIAARILWGWAADRFAPHLVLAGIGFGMSGAAVLAAMLGPDWPYAAVIALATAFGATATAWQGVYLAEVARHAPQDRVADATSGGMAITFLCSLLGPGAFSALSGITGNTAAGFLTVGVVTFLFALAFLRAEKPA